MQTPQRKPGKYSNIKPDANITKEKYHSLQYRLEKLIKHSRPQAAEEVKRLAADGDFSENHAYQMAKGRLRGINSRISEIEDHLKRAIIIQSPQNNDKAQLGHRVYVDVGGKEKCYLILGPSETDPENNIISYLSPLGKLLIGKKAGETAVLVINGQEKKYLLKKIE